MTVTVPGTAANAGLTRGPFRAPRGPVISCQGWQQEAALRMLLNNVDPEVAEKPEDLVVYGGTGKAARNWECFHAMVRSLKSLDADETLLVQSGKPVGVFRTHEYAPRVLLCNSNLVGHWNNWDRFHELDRAGLMMYGQMTAGSWIYIGTQGILQGTYETFAAAAKKHFGGNLAGKLVVTGGMGGMGGAQPLAATMNGAAFLGIDVDPERIKRRVKTGYCDVMVTSLDEALRILKNAVRKGEATSVGLEELRGLDSGAGEARSSAGFADGPDQRARSHRRICAERHDAGSGAGAAREKSRGIQETFAGGDGAARPGDAGFAEAGRGDV